jgi:hypothetical protein
VWGALCILYLEDVVSLPREVISCCRIVFTTLIKPMWFLRKQIHTSDSLWPGNPRNRILCHKYYQKQRLMLEFHMPSSPWCRDDWWNSATVISRSHPGNHVWSPDPTASILLDFLRNMSWWRYFMLPSIGSTSQGRTCYFMSTDVILMGCFCSEDANFEFMHRKSLISGMG